MNSTKEICTIFSRTLLTFFCLLPPTSDTIVGYEPDSATRTSLFAQFNRLRNWIEWIWWCVAKEFDVLPSIRVARIARTNWYRKYQKYGHLQTKHVVYYIVLIHIQTSSIRFYYFYRFQFVFRNASVKVFMWKSPVILECKDKMWTVMFEWVWIKDRFLTDKQK